MNLLTLTTTILTAFAVVGSAQFTITSFNFDDDFVTVVDLASSTHKVIRPLSTDPCSSVCLAKQTLLASCFSSTQQNTRCYCMNGYASALQGCNDCKSKNGDDGFFSFLPGQVSRDCARITGGSSGGAEPTTVGARTVTRGALLPTDTGAADESTETGSPTTTNGSSAGSSAPSKRPEALLLTVAIGLLAAMLASM